MIKAATTATEDAAAADPAAAAEAELPTVADAPPEPVADEEDTEEDGV